MTIFRILAIAVLILVAWPGASAAQSAVSLSADIEEALNESGEVRVVVLLNLPTLASHDERSARSNTIRAAADDLLSDYGQSIVVHHRFELVEALALSVDRQTAERLVQDPRIAGLDLDVRGTGDLDVAVPLLNMDILHDLNTAVGGVQGQGVKVAIVDSGIESAHDDFSGALVDEACFCSGNNGCCPSGGTTQFGSGAAEDDHGHGTWVSGFTLGRGNIAPPGAAPQADLVSVKVLDSGNGFCCSSDITAAFDWLAVNHPDLDVLNASLGTNARFPNNCDTETAWTTALASAVSALASNGTLVVGSSGNDADTNGVGAPACLTEVMAVGATYKRAYSGAFNFSACSELDPAAEQLTCYTNSYSGLEIVAPGSRMVTTGLNNTVTSESLNGTSFASPLVAGCAAQLRSAFPDISRAGLRTALKQSPITVHDPRNSRSYPRLDCHAAFLSLDWIFADRFD